MTLLPDKTLKTKNIQKLAVLSLLLAFSLILSYVESIIPIPVLPGIKLGLSNIAVVFTLYVYEFPTAIIFGVIKVLLSLIFTGRLSSIFFSLTGIILAVSGMWVLKKTRLFSLLGVNVSGAVFHVLGQMTAAQFVLGNESVWRFLPLMTCLSIVSGILSYLLIYAVFRILKIQPE